jgi:argininosuccinate lyase
MPDPREARNAAAVEPSGVRKGRFEGPMDELFSRFNSSVSFDRRLARQDVAGGIAHARMLGARGIISREEAAALEAGLREVEEDVRAGRLEFRDDLEDVHINVEEALRAKIGDLAGKLHTARSRNDQVALDLRLFVRDAGRDVSARLVSLAEVLVDASDRRLDAILPGYTHLQRAQPVRLAHHLTAYVQMLFRDYDRFRCAAARTDDMPLGSAALAGTTFDLDREMTARELGFARVSVNSMDAVSDRDFVLDFLYNCAVVSMHLSRLAEELILWSTSEFGFCELPDRFCSGSSIMPQKKNPDACELIRGKTGRVYGDLIGLLTTLKALPLTYNKDLQEDKEPLFDAYDTVADCLEVMTAMIPLVTFHTERMSHCASDPSLAATDVADRLTRAGLPFREAHARVGAMVRAAAGGLESREDLPTPEEMVEARNQTGGTARSRVLDQIRDARVFIEEARKITGFPARV